MIEITTPGDAPVANASADRFAVQSRRFRALLDGIASLGTVDSLAIYLAAAEWALDASVCEFRAGFETADLVYRSPTSPVAADARR